MAALRFPQLSLAYLLPALLLVTYVQAQWSPMMNFPQGAILPGTQPQQNLFNPANTQNYQGRRVEALNQMYRSLQASNPSTPVSGQTLYANNPFPPLWQQQQQQQQWSPNQPPSPAPSASVYTAAQPTVANFFNNLNQQVPGWQGEYLLSFGNGEQMFVDTLGRKLFTVPPPSPSTGPAAANQVLTSGAAPVPPGSQGGGPGPQQFPPSSGFNNQFKVNPFPTGPSNQGQSPNASQLTGALGNSPIDAEFVSYVGPVKPEWNLPPSTTPPPTTPPPAFNPSWQSTTFPQSGSFPPYNPSNGPFPANNWQQPYNPNFGYPPPQPGAYNPQTPWSGYPPNNPYYGGPQPPQYLPPQNPMWPPQNQFPYPQFPYANPQNPNFGVPTQTPGGFNPNPNNPPLISGPNQQQQLQQQQQPPNPQNPLVPQSPVMPLNPTTGQNPTTTQVQNPTTTPAETTTTAAPTGVTAPMSTMGQSLMTTTTTNPLGLMIV